MSNAFSKLRLFLSVFFMIFRAFEGFCTKSAS